MQNHSNLTTTTQTGSTEHSNRQQAANLVNKIFRSLTAIFPAWGAAIKDQEAMNQAKAEWFKGLIENNITSDIQIDAGLAKARTHNSPFLPSIGQFISWCKDSTGEQLPPIEVCVVEIQNFVRQGRKDTYNMTPFVYHMVVKNLDFYNFKKLEKEYDRNKALEIAYKATLFQLECGEKLIAPPPPETLLESKKPEKSSNDMQKVGSPINELLAMFEEPQQQKQLTQAEIDDLAKLERLKNDV
jgi:hypothetical protein